MILCQAHAVGQVRHNASAFAQLHQLLNAFLTVHRFGLFFLLHYILRRFSLEVDVELRHLQISWQKGSQRLQSLSKLGVILLLWS